MSPVPPFERSVTLDVSAGMARAEVEDHIHHVAATIHHDTTIVTAVEAEVFRLPWTTCPDAAGELDRLVGTPVGSSIGEMMRSGSPREQCTHLFEVGVLAIRNAGGPAVARRYDMAVAGWDGPRQTATLVRDDGLRLEWEVGRDGILAPETFAGRPLLGGFSTWLSTLEPELADAAFLLRRATWMAASRGFDLDRYEQPAESGLLTGVCYTSQPQRIHLARRVRAN